MAKRKPEADPLSDLISAATRLKEAGSRVGDAARKGFRETLESVAADLQGIAEGRDPIRRPSSVFDPTDPRTAGRVIAAALMAQSRERLEQSGRFYGAGVYAIYYGGGDRAYEPISKSEHPIYLGKADPADGQAKTPLQQGTRLWSRMKEHARSIKSAGNLDIGDFECRFLVVASGWQKAAEEYLIAVFKPIWNSEVNVCFGIGKHGDAAATRANKRSPWDTMHPGRSWAHATKEDQFTREQIEERIALHFQQYPPYQTREELFQRFIEDMKQQHPKK